MFIMAPGSETWVLEYSRAPAHYATDASTLTDSDVGPADALLAGFLGDSHDEERARKRNGTKGEGGREWGREGGRDKGMSRASEVPQIIGGRLSWMPVWPAQTRVAPRLAPFRLGRSLAWYDSPTGHLFPLSWAWCRARNTTYVGERAPSDAPPSGCGLPTAELPPRSSLGTPRARGFRMRHSQTV